MKVDRCFLAVAVLCCVPLSTAFADIYQYVDQKGVVHFSNVGGGKGQRRVAQEPARITVMQPRSAENSGTTTIYSSDYTEIINEACDKHGVDPALVHAVVKVESDFNAYALSRKGAMGLMQLMPQTATEMNVRNSFNPVENIHGGVKYLRYLIDRYEGNLRLALAAYNSGESAVRRWGTIPPFRETQRYVKKVLALYNGGDISQPVRSYTTIFVATDNDGTLLLTDNPSNHPKKKFRKRAGSAL